MALYEHIFMARQDVSASQVETLTEQFKSIITEHGGTTGKTEYWGLRTLAYKVQKNRKAHYTLIDIDAEADAITEMERQMRINDDVIRFVTFRVDEHNDEQSAILTRREERGGRGGRGDRGDRGPRGDRGDRGGDRGGDRSDRGDRPRRDDAPAETRAE